MRVINGEYTDTKIEKMNFDNSDFAIAIGWTVTPTPQDPFTWTAFPPKLEGKRNT